MKKKLFSERRGGLKPRVKEELEEQVATSLLALISARIDENWFGQAFPSECMDGGHNDGCDRTKLEHAIRGWDLPWPQDWLRRDKAPPDPHLFDLVEFAYEHIALPESYEFHGFMRHDHYRYDQEQGRDRFAQEVNRIFERQGIAFELVDGEVTRIAPTGMQEALAETVFKTGDANLDRLLETAREKFLNRDLETRKESLEKLWDAWERLKTIEPGKDKKAQATVLLDRASTEPEFRSRLEDEAKELTSIGNNFMIRHTETTKTPIGKSEHVDYLFHRMFALIRLLLRSSGRGG